MRPFLCNTVILSFSFYSWCKVRIWNANSVSHSRVAKCSQYFLYIFPFQKFAVQNFQFSFNFCTDHFWKVEFTVFQVKSPHVSRSHFVPVWYPDANLKLLSGYIFKFVHSDSSMAELFQFVLSVLFGEEKCKYQTVYKFYIGKLNLLPIRCSISN